MVKGPFAAGSAPDSLPPEAVPSFASLYRESFDRVWGVLRALGVPAEALEDAAQEVWIVVYRRIADFEGRSKIETWLFGIALNVARNWRRAERRKTDVAPLPEEIVSAEPDAAALRQGREAWLLVERFVSTLDVERREIFVGGLLQGFTAPEVADATGADIATVYNRIRALRRSFRTWAEKENYEL